MSDFTQPFCIETNAPNIGVGATLAQKGHPLAFISKPFEPQNTKFSTYEKEYMAILIVV
jgi:hypothetical protein